MISYILSPIDHKGTAELTPEISIHIDKSYENNLRERNTQLGLVEYIGSENPLSLSIGDTVAVNHRTFYGNIGENRGFIEKDHIVYDGKKLFKVLPEQILFKYNNKAPEPLGDTVLCTGVEEVSELMMQANADLNFYRSKEFSQRGTVLIGDMAGTEILVLKSAFYLVTLDKVDYFKVRKSEIVATIVDGIATPFGKYLKVLYKGDLGHAFLDLSFAKCGISVKATVIAKGCESDAKWIAEGCPEVGDDVLVYRNNGVKFGENWFIDNEMVVFKYEEA